MQIFRICFAFILISSIHCSQTKYEPVTKAIGGILDLRKHSFSRKAKITLAGEWEFYWQQFCFKHLKVKLSAGTIPCSTLANKRYVELPAYWNKLEESGKEIGGQGFATYHLTILLSDTLVNAKEPKFLALKLPEIATAYTLYINNKKKVTVGQIGKQREKTQPAYLPQIITIPIVKKNLQLTFHIANFHDVRGGIAYLIELGTVDCIQKTRIKKISLDLFLMGALSLMGIYHLGLYAIRRKEKSPLFFGFLCLL
ncbi:MAG: hypothetical protein AAF518_14655, partial [Spirochaetota bacterium]